MEFTFDIKPSCKAEEYLFKLNKEANKKNTPNIRKLIEKRGKQIKQFAKKMHS